MTLAEFERLCLEGPLDSLTPEDELRAMNRVQALAEKFRRRLVEASNKWTPPKPTRRRGNGSGVPVPPAAGRGIERSLPAGDA